MELNFTAGIYFGLYSEIGSSLLERFILRFQSSTRDILPVLLLYHSQELFYRFTLNVETPQPPWEICRQLWWYLYLNDPVWCAANRLKRIDGVSVRVYMIVDCVIIYLFLYLMKQCTIVYDNEIRGLLTFNNYLSRIVWLPTFAKRDQKVISIQMAVIKWRI